VQRYRLIDVKIGPWKPKEREPDSEAKWNQRKHLSGADRDPNAMDIDTTEIDVNIAQEKKPVICYYCNNKGHSKRDCHKLKADNRRERTNLQMLKSELLCSKETKQEKKLHLIQTHSWPTSAD